MCIEILMVAVNHPPEAILYSTTHSASAVVMSTPGEI